MTQSQETENLRQEIADLFDWYFFKHSDNPSSWVEAKRRVEKLRGNKSEIGFKS